MISGGDFMAYAIGTAILIIAIAGAICALRKGA